MYKCCSNCKHVDIIGTLEPCESCECHNNWQPEEIPTGKEVLKMKDYKFQTNFSIGDRWIYEKLTKDLGLDSIISDIATDYLGTRINSCLAFYIKDSTKTDYFEEYCKIKKEYCKIKKEGKEVIKMEEFSFEEVISRIKEGQTYKCTDNLYLIESVCKKNESIEIHFGEVSNILTIKNIRFTLISQSVSFMEAVQAKNEGKFVYSIFDGVKRLYQSHYFIDQFQCGISPSEILEGKWFIDED